MHKEVRGEVTLVLSKPHRSPQTDAPADLAAAAESSATWRQLPAAQELWGGGGNKLTTGGNTNKDLPALTREPEEGGNGARPRGDEGLEASAQNPSQV